jgi:phage host-nuclease inhibitor protein Gam
MGVVNDIKKAGSTVTKEASKFTQVQLQQRKLRSLQGDVARAEQEMGGMVYDLAEHGELTHPALDATQARIKVTRDLVAEKENEIAKLKSEISEDVGGARDAYVERLKTQLGEWSADIEKLKARAGKISADARAEYDEQLANLRQQRDAMAARISDLQEASDEAWDDVKQGVQAAWDLAKESFQKAMARFGRDNDVTP